jgi:hypothetical protein
MINYLCYYTILQLILTNVWIIQQLIYQRVQTLGERTSFIPEERRLWSSHIKLALTIGRGQAACARDSESSLSLLHDWGIRLEIYQHITRIERERCHLQTDKLYWPLFLPALQHGLIGSTLSCIQSEQGHATNTELFICDAFLNSIERVLDGPTIEQSAFPEVIDDIHIPVSLRDAR